MNIHSSLEKILSLLRVRPPVGGLEISDSAVRFALLSGSTWNLKSVRLAPGVVVGGRLKDRERFIAALEELRGQVFVGRDRGEQVSAVAVLSSLDIYSQVFSLPMVAPENLKRAVELNIQMVSPIEISQAYSGWQLVGEDKNALKLEVLGAFIDRQSVDEIVQALVKVGFLVVAVESRALALARLLRAEVAGFDPSRPAIVVSLDNGGLDFMIVRHGQLYFEYFSSWRDIVDEKQQMSFGAFEATVVRSLHQVLNFYSQHWPEPIADIFLSASGLVKETIKIINENFSLPVKEVALKTVQSAGPEWFVVMGSGLRGLEPRRKDKEISLLELSVEDEFRREQILAFARFWGVVVPSALMLLIAVFFAADLWLAGLERRVRGESLVRGDEAATQEMEKLLAQAREFNRAVGLIRSVEQSRFPHNVFIDQLRGLAEEHGVTLAQVTFPSVDAPTNVFGRAKSETEILAFKKALEERGTFENIDLPLTSIQKGPGNLSFAVSFTAKFVPSGTK